MVATLLDTARDDVLEGRRRLASQEQLVDDLLRIGCTSLLPLAERLLRYTRERQQAKERRLERLVIAADLAGLASSSPSRIGRAVGANHAASKNRPPMETGTATHTTM